MTIIYNCRQFYNDILHRLLLVPVVLLVAAEALAGSASKSEFERFYNTWKSKPVTELKRQGVEAVKKGDMDMALTFFNMIVKRYDKDAPRDEQLVYVSAYINAGGILYSMYSDYQQAYNYYMSAFEISKRMGYANTYPYIYANVGTIYSDLEDDDRAMEYFLKAIDYSLRDADWYVSAIVATNILSHALENNKLSQYFYVVGKLQKARVPNSSPSGRYINQYCRVLTSYHNGRYAEALGGLDTLASYVDDNVYEVPGMMLAIVHRGKAQVYSAVKRYEEAIRECKQGVALVMANDPNNIMLKDNFITISRYFSNIGRMDSAYYYWDKARTFRAGAVLKARSAKIDAMESLFKLSKKNAEIDEITRRNSFITMMLIIAGLVVVAVMSMLLVVYRHNKSLRTKNRLIYHKNMQLLDQEKDTRQQILSYENRIALYESKLASASAAAEKEGCCDAPGGQGERPAARLCAAGGDKAEPDMAAGSKYRNSTLDETTKLDILNKVQAIMDESGDIYEPDFSIDRLAVLVNSKTKYISQVINEFYKKNFSAFLGEYRIREACRRMSDTARYGNYTIEAIAVSVGFKSRSAFATVFKKITGITPSEYLKIADGKDE